MLAYLVFSGMILMIPLSIIWSFFLVIFPLTTPLMLLYLLYIFKFDNSPTTGTRRPFLRYWIGWKYFAEFFPIRLIRHQPLDPAGRYIFSYHPHGIISIGAFASCATNALSFDTLFRGIRIHLLTLRINFLVPFFREILLHLGACNVEKATFYNILNQGPGSAVMVVVGGAAESLETHPGMYRLTILDRKGFVRVALDTGASLVPVIGFGENDLWDTYIYPPGTWGRWIQDRMKGILGFTLPVFYGRGFFKSNGFGLMPHRRPIVVVVGPPIEIPQVPERLRGDNLFTTEEGRALVAKYHDLYLSKLTDLFNQYKSLYAPQRLESINFITNT